MSDPEDTDADKGSGRGRGKFAVAGHEADQEARLTAIEDYLSDLIELGQLPATEIGEGEEVTEA